MTDRVALACTFIVAAGWADATRVPLAGDASARRYDRLIRHDGRSAVLMDAPPGLGLDVRPFLRIDRHLSSLGLSAPEVLAEDPANGFLLLEDFGDAVFSRVIAADPSIEADLYSAAIDVLTALRDPPPPAGLVELDPPEMARIANMVLDWYLPGAGDVPPHGHVELQRVMTDLGSLIDGRKVLMLRDYHAENLIWLPDRRGTARVGLLDFQDAMTAHAAYDLVSILQDARRDVTPELEAAMIRRYVAATGMSLAPFSAAYALLGALRALRIMGVFARLSMHSAKPHYVDLIPRVWGYLMRDLSHPSVAPLAALVTALVPQPTPARLLRIKEKCGTILKP